MKKFIHKKYIKEIFIYAFFLFAVEILFRATKNFTIFSWSSWRILLSCLALSFLLHFLLAFCKNEKTQDIVRILVLFIANLYAWLQVGFENFLGNYMSIGTSGQIGAVTSYIKGFLLSYHLEHLMVLAPFFLYIVYVVLIRRKEKESLVKVSIWQRVSLLFITAVLSGLYFLTLYIPFMQNPIQLVENKDLFFSPTNASVAINQFGTSMYGLLDVKQQIFPINILENSFEKEENEEEEVRTFDDTAWESVLQEEKNETYRTLDEYFLSRTITQPNDYTGYFEGKNLIVIMMESVNNIILNEEYFPNFAKILEHSWYWENSYSPRNACPTGDNEFSGMTSIYAINTSCTANTYPDNQYFTSIFNRFNAAGYTTSSYHNLDSTYYARDVFHLSMGSGHYYDGNELGISFDSSNFVEWPSDVELMEKASAIFSQNESFMAWITTVTAHQPYEEESTYGEKYLSLFDDTDYSITLKRYLSKLKVTDDALGALLQELEAKDILDDTVIVLYGDHYPYGLSNEDVAAAVDYDITDFYEIERTPFVIYNSTLEPQVFEENTFYMNILPTLLNLFDLDYDPRLYFGEDLFSPTYSNRVIFADGSWQDTIARYDASTGEVTYLGEETYTLKEIQKINREIYLKKQMSQLAVTTNYYQDLEEKIEAKQRELKEEENIYEESDDR